MYWLLCCQIFLKEAQSVLSEHPCMLAKTGTLIMSFDTIHCSVHFMDYLRADDVIFLIRDCLMSIRLDKMKIS